MAELGLLANVAQVIGLGLGLSKLLFEFASTIGSASSDVKSLATNITLFCSVLGQVKTALSKSSRLSAAALDTADEVVRGCQIILDDLDAKVRKLRGAEDILARVKWFFKQKSILLVHEQLRTCSATLHLMLTTLMLADRVAARRISGLQPDDQEEKDRMLTHVTYMAQQAAQERLAAMEEDLDMISLSGSTLTHRRNRSSRIIDGDVLNLPSKRFSVDLDRHMSRLSVVDPIDADSPSEELLRQWTDQGDPARTWPKDDEYSAPEDDEYSIRNDHEDNDPNDHEGSVSKDEKPSVEFLKTFRIGVDDPTWKVLPAALRKYNIVNDWKNYNLFLVYENLERVVLDDERPLALFKELDKQGKKPMFMLRKREQPREESPAVEPYVCKHEPFNFI